MELVRRWVLLNPNIKDGDQIIGRIFLLNKELIMSFDELPVKDNVLVESCHFFGEVKDLRDDLLIGFSDMVEKGELFREVMQ